MASSAPVHPVSAGVVGAAAVFVVDVFAVVCHLKSYCKLRLTRLLICTIADPQTAAAAVFSFAVPSVLAACNLHHLHRPHLL